LLEEVGPLIAWLTEAATQSASVKAAGMLTWAAQVIGERVDEDTPDADQVEGPSLDDVAELCKEFGFVPGNNGALLAADVFRAPPLSPLPMLRDMITAAITRWRAPVAQPVAKPVDLAELHDPSFSGGLTPSQHLDVLHGGPDPRTAATVTSGGADPAAGNGEGEGEQDDLTRLKNALHKEREGNREKERLRRVRELTLAAIIREVDGGNRLGAAGLAEAILAHPGFSGCHDGTAALLAPGFQIGPQEYIPNA
jgi:hypothetical protein